MRFSRSLASGVLGVVTLVLLIGTGINACDDKMSRQLDNDDITWDEVSPKPGQNIPFKGDK